MSKILNREVLTLWNLRTGSMKRERENDNSDGARSKAWNLDKKRIQGQRKRQGYIPVSPRRNGCSRLRQRKTHRKESLFLTRERFCIGSARETWLCWVGRPWGHQEVRRWPTARFKTREEATVYVKQLDLFVKGVLLEETPAVLSLEKLCEDHGYTHHWTSGQKPPLFQMESELIAAYRSYVPCVVRGSSASSSSITPSHISPFIFIIGFRIRWWQKQKSSNPKEAKVRVKFREDPLHESTEAEKWNQGCGTAEGFIAWVAWVATGIHENVVDESVPAEPLRPLAWISTRFQVTSWTFNGSRAVAEPGSGEHSADTHSQWPKLRYLFEDEGNEGFLQMTHRCSRTWSGKFWWLDNFRITKFSVKEVNHVIIMNTLLWYKIFQVSGYNLTRAKLSGDPEEPHEVSGANEET